MKSAGEAYVTAVESFNSQNPGLTGTYMDSKSAKAEKRARINLLDLKEQGVGEAHVFFKSRIIRANLFFMDPGPAKAMRLNLLLKVEIPKDEVLYTLVKSIEDFEELINTSGVPAIKVESDEEVERIATSMSKQPRMIDAIDRGINVLFEVHKQLIQKESGQKEVVEHAPLADANEITKQDGIPEDSHKTTDAQVSAKNLSIDIFMRVALSSKEIALIQADENKEIFEMPLINLAKMTTTSLYLLRLLGRTKDQASPEVTETVQLIRSKTSYAQGVIPSIDQLNGSIHALIKGLSTN